MNPASIVLDGRRVPLAAGDTILDAARRAGVEIPALCKADGLAPEGGCRVCLVEVDGAARPEAACHTPARDGMVVRSASPRLAELRRGLLSLMIEERGTDAAAARCGCAFERLAAEHGATWFVGSRDPANAERGATAATDASHPYLRFDPELCISCRVCLNACEQVQGQFVYGIDGRGGAVRLIFGPTERFADSDCVACGACVTRCPTGAIHDVDRLARVASTIVTDTTCGYCGVGCRLRVASAGDAVLRIDAPPDAAVNGGHLCVKGRYAHAWARSEDRLATPLLREGGALRPIGWQEAIAWLAGRLREIRDRHGPDSLAALTSARSTNESAYLLQKLFRTAIGTNNVDCCARVCHASTAVALYQSTGSSAGTASFADIERARCIVLAGSNASSGHPVVGARIKQAALAGVPLIVIDPRRVELADYARLHLPVRAGTNVPLFYALAKVLVDEGLCDDEYVAARCEGWEELRAMLASQTLEALAAPTEVPVESIRRAARLMGALRPALFVHGIGLSELTQGVASVQTLINLGMLTGSIGRPGAGMLPLRGQNNVQGNVDMGGSPTSLTGNQRLDDPAVRARFKAVWGKAPPERPGRMLPDMLAAAADGVIRGMWVQGFDLVQSAPHESATIDALSKLELLVVQDIFAPEIARFAHLLLPAASTLEQSGTFTNAERRIQLVRPVLDPPGEAREEWRILQDVAHAMGETWDYSSAADVMDEIARVAPAAFGGVSHARLAGDGLQWPCPSADHPGTATVHANGFVRGRGSLAAIAYAPSPEQTDAEYPFLLTTGRRLEQFNVGTMTRRTANQQLAPEDELEIHPDDAARAGLRDGAMADVISRWGGAQVRVRLTERVGRGRLFLTFHQPASHTNRLTSPYVDPQSKCPEYKVTAARVECGGRK